MVLKLGARTQIGSLWNGRGIRLLQANISSHRIFCDNIKALDLHTSSPYCLQQTTSFVLHISSCGVLTLYILNNMYLHRKKWINFNVTETSTLNLPGITESPLGLSHHTALSMMTSSNGNIFRVTGPLCGEFTGPGEFPTQRPVTRSFDVYFDQRLNKRLCKQS